MSKQQYFLGFLATNLLVALTNQSAMGFTLKYGNGATNYYNPTVPYVIDANTRGTTFLSPRYVAPIKLGGTNDFLKMLNNDVRWQGWDFISSDKNLYGNFEISDYYGCGAQTICAKERPKDTIRGGVGAYIDIKYNPKKTDPKPGQGKIHWIQRVVNNHTLYDEQQSTSGGGLHGVRYDGIDIPPFQNANPYYRGGNEFSSFDRPYRNDANQPHTWFAELYLVEEIAPKTVKIYNGVRWGWINRVYHRQNPLPMPIPRPIPERPIPIPRPIPRPIPVPIVCNGGSGGGGCYRTAGADYVDYQEPSIFDPSDANENDPQYEYSSFFNPDGNSWTEDEEQWDYENENVNWTEDQEIPPFNEYDDSQSPASVPESTPALGLLALAAWGALKALKIKKDKQR